MSALLVLALAGLATYALRAAPIVVLARRPLPPGLARPLEHATPAVLAALVATAVVGEGGPPDLVVPSPRSLAALAAGVVAWRTRDVLAPMAAGLGAFWVLSALWP